jgi:hypothetical protein
MSRCCEICGPEVRAAGKPAARLSRFIIERRIVVLCKRHAAAVRLAGPETLAELRALFHETWGKRSLLPRRAPLDRRIFPARPEGRRLGIGRRANDLDADR